MKATPRSASLNSVLLVAVLASAAFFLVHANTVRASAAPTTVPLVTLHVEPKLGNLKTSTGAASSSAASGSGSGDAQGTGGKSKSGTTTAGTQNAWYEITVKNVGEGPITGLTINYHVYVNTITMSKTASDIALSDSNGTVTLDLPFSSSKLVETTPVAKSYSSTSNPSTSKKGVSSTSTSTSTTTIAGYYITAVYNGKPIIRPVESPSGIKARYDAQAASSN
jgi:hypothetical protein